MNEFDNMPAGFSGLPDDAVCDSCEEPLSEDCLLTEDGQFCDEHCEADFAVAHNLVVVL